MKTAFIILLTIWLLVVSLTSCARADYNDVYSLYLERGNYLHEVASGRMEYNPEVDKAIGIDIQNACDEVGRSNLKHCWYNMLFQTGADFTPYSGF
jgi:hypothetical protein